MTRASGKRELVRIDVHGRSYAYTLVRSRKRRKTMAMRVHADASIEVRAPWHMSGDVVAAWVRQRASWLDARLARARSLQEKFPSLSYTGGERHLYLGCEYRLCLAQGERSGTHGEVLVLDMRGDRSAESVRHHLYRWYRRQAEVVFAARLQAMATDIPWLHALPPLSIRRMRRQWGSCSSRGRIALNLHLIKAPEACIDYVLAHELCHLRELHHGRAFYRLLDALMPCWPQRKQRLEAMAPALLRQ